MVSYLEGGGGGGVGGVIERLQSFCWRGRVYSTHLILQHDVCMDHLEQSRRSPVSFQTWNQKRISLETQLSLLQQEIKSQMV